MLSYMKLKSCKGAKTFSFFLSSIQSEMIVKKMKTLSSLPAVRAGGVPGGTIVLSRERTERSHRSKKK